MHSLGTIPYVWLSCTAEDRLVRRHSGCWALKIIMYFTDRSIFEVGEDYHRASFLSWYFLGFAVAAWVLDCVAFSTKLSSREHEIAGGILSLFMSSVRTWVVALFTTSKLLPAKRGQTFSKMLPDTFWRDNPSRYGLWLMSKVCPWRHQTSACTSF